MKAIFSKRNDMGEYDNLCITDSIELLSIKILGLMLPFFNFHTHAQKKKKNEQVNFLVLVGVKKFYFRTLFIFVYISFL